MEKTNLTERISENEQQLLQEKSSIQTTEIDLEKQLEINGTDEIGFHRENHRKSETEQEDEKNVFDGNRCSKVIERLETKVDILFESYAAKIRKMFNAALFLAFLSYYAYSMYFRFGDQGSILLTVITGGVVLKVVRQYMVKSGKTFTLKGFVNTCGGSSFFRRMRGIFKRLLYLIATCGMMAYLGITVFSNHPSNVQSFVGIIIIVIFCFVTSSKPSRVNWHPVFWGFMIQFIFATITLKTTTGYNIFKWLGDKIEDFVKFSDHGSRFVISQNFKEMGLAFSIAGVFIFFNATIFVLNHWGVIEFIVLTVGRFLSVCLETGPVESIVAAANIFVGLAEAPLLIRPYLSTITRSELHAVMTCGFASIAGTTMGMFIRYGAPANHLLTAAVISAPAALATTKLMCPETERVNYESQKNVTMRDENQKEQTTLQAAGDGAVLAVKMIANICGMMLAFFSGLQMMNTLLGWFGERAGIQGLSFDVICSYVLFPLAFLMGASLNDCRKIGSLIGVKLFATPMIGYMELGKMIKNREALEHYLDTTNGTWQWVGEDVLLNATNVTLINGIMEERSEVISTYAMCGFSAFPAIGICMGTLIPMSPSRKKDVVSLVMRAFVAGNVASFITGAVAGVMFTGSSLPK